jgi:phosphatidate cytidylyltransferase
MLKQRIITALLLAPVLLAIVIYGNAIWMALLVGVIQWAATYEWLKINQLKASLAVINGVMLTALTSWLFHLGLPAETLMMGAYLVVWILAVLWLMNHRWGSANQTIHVLLKGILGVVAIMIFAISLNRLHGSVNGQWLTLGLFVLIWVADIGAYVSGKTMGRHKLAINISPGKTWEGVLGAQLFVALYALLLAHYLNSHWLYTVLVMMGIALFSVVGDLAASLGKRQAGVKDSSQLLPGHGGFIDRFDSLIAAAPLYLYALSWL